ncbi:MAG: hypothetical protein M1823_005518 [Watsoniomyces obsoletus]|nr:MAG: hypothetical protein M1823_005518 [Watsoniomyces obsoletus]
MARSMHSLPTESSPLAPKAFIDLKHIRTHPELYSRNCAARNYTNLIQTPYRIVELFESWKKWENDFRRLRERRQDVQRQLGQSSSTDHNAGDVPSGDISLGDTSPTTDRRSQLLQEASEIKEQLAGAALKQNQLQTEMQTLAVQLPNLTSGDTPLGDEPRVVRYLPGGSSDPSISLQERRDWRSHVDIGTELDLLDFVSASRTSGWGWYFLKDEAALLEQALVRYALDVGMRKGWRVVTPPSIVYTHLTQACGFQPRDQNGEQQIYSLHRSLEDQRKPERSLAGTAEIPLAGMKANVTMMAEELPYKIIGVSRCYRAEAGARGVDTKGLYRVHEFTKVEMFAWTLPETEKEEEGINTESPPTVFNEMVTIQSEILESLGLPSRVLEMPSTDLGASAIRKQDIEVWFPSRQREHQNGGSGWGEVTSASMCSDYQTRRLATRVKDRSSSGHLGFPHTVNGTAMAVPRVLAALLEHGWDEKTRTVRIPGVLRAYMSGQEVIRKR